MFHGAARFHASAEIPRHGRDSTARQRFHGAAMFHASADVPGPGPPDEAPAIARASSSRNAGTGLTPGGGGCRREPCEAGKTFNSLCTTILSATTTVRALCRLATRATECRPRLLSALHGTKRSTLQYLPGGVLGVHFLDNALKNAVLVENECSPERPQCGLTVHFLLTPRAEGLEHLRGGVRK